MFDNEERAIGSYRHAVSKQIPEATRIAWSVKESEIRKDLPGMTRKEFLYNLSRASYEKEWGRNYQKPTAMDRFLALLYRILPKIGPLRVLTFRTPTPETEKLFEGSFNATLDEDRKLMQELEHGPIALPNKNIDVGEVTARGKYQLYDKTCVQLVDKLAESNFAQASPELRAELLRFFAEPPGPEHAQMKKKDRERLASNLAQLREAGGKTAAPAQPTEPSH